MNESQNNSCVATHAKLGYERALRGKNLIVKSVHSREYSPNLNFQCLESTLANIFFLGKRVLSPIVIFDIPESTLSIGHSCTKMTPWLMLFDETSGHILS